MEMRFDSRQKDKAVVQEMQSRKPFHGDHNVVWHKVRGGGTAALKGNC